MFTPVDTIIASPPAVVVWAQCAGLDQGPHVFASADLVLLLGPDATLDARSINSARVYHLTFSSPSPTHGNGAGRKGQIGRWTVPASIKTPYLRQRRPRTWV